MLLFFNITINITLLLLLLLLLLLQSSHGARASTVISQMRPNI
jgi:preprotein translocase subunit SecG